MYQNISALGAEVYPKMPRKQEKVVSEDNGSAPQHDEFGPDPPTLADIYRLFEDVFNRRLKTTESHFDQQDKALDDLTEKMRETRQRLAGLEQQTRQPRLATEADVKPDTKTRKRTEDTAADRVIIRDSSSAQVDPVPMCLISFDDDSTDSLTFPCCRGDALADKGTAVPTPCLSPVEIRTLTTAGSLLPAGTTSTATKTISHQPPLWFYSTKDMSSRTSIQYATTYYSIF